MSRKYNNPIEDFEDHANYYGSVILTGNGDETNSSFSLIAYNPNYIVKFQNNKLFQNGNEIFTSDPWKHISEILQNSDYGELEFLIFI